MLNVILNFLFIFVFLFVLYFCSFYVCRVFIIWFSKYVYDIDEDFFDGLDGGLVFGGVFVVVWVIVGRVEDGDVD